jgi:DNA-binding NarL/FixJ family response regulator
VRVAIADDAILFREGLARVLRDAGFEVVAQAGDAQELLAAVRREDPEVVIVDIRMPPTNTTEGLEAALRIRADHPGVGVIVLSQHVETYNAVELLGTGSGHVGYLLKDRVSDLGEFADSVRRVADGGSVIDPDIVARLLGPTRDRGPLETLTERERDILALMAEGRSNQAISQRLFLSPKTVESHIGSIFTKLGLLPDADDHRRVMAVIAFLRASSAT